jgi:hypothetical protein
MKSAVIIFATVLSMSITALVGVVSYMMGSRPAATPVAVSGVVTPSTPITPATTAAPEVSTKQSAAPQVSTRTVYVTPKAKAPTRVTLGSLGPKPCTTLFNRDVSYERMWRYYEEFGYPDSMDVDHDGFPCETVYGNVN